jgi:hypothetical protein
MSLDPITSFNNQSGFTFGSSGENPELIRFDPAQVDFSAIEGFNTLPRAVQDSLKTNGAYSLNPVNSWIKTNISQGSLATLFGGDTIYTMPPNQSDLYQTIDVNLYTQNFNTFLANLFSDSEELKDVYEDSSDDPYNKDRNNSPQLLTNALNSLLKGKIKP